MPFKKLTNFSATFLIASTTLLNKDLLSVAEIVFVSFVSNTVFTFFNSSTTVSLDSLVNDFTFVFKLSNKSSISSSPPPPITLEIISILLSPSLKLITFTQVDLKYLSNLNGSLINLSSLGK